MFEFSEIILIVTAVTSGLIAGLFYAYSCSVNLGLGRLPDDEYLRAMQLINRAILNPVFFMTFMGTAILLPVSTFLQYEHSIRFLFLLMASLIYLAGVFGVTIFGNVPLNRSLDKFDLHSAPEKEIAAYRINFENPWNRLNLIRTIASSLSLIFVIIACLNK